MNLKFKTALSIPVWMAGEHGQTIKAVSKMDLTLHKVQHHWNSSLPPRHRTILFDSLSRFRNTRIHHRKPHRGNHTVRASQLLQHNQKRINVRQRFTRQENKVSKSKRYLKISSIPELLFYRYQDLKNQYLSLPALHHLP